MQLCFSHNSRIYDKHTNRLCIGMQVLWCNHYFAVPCIFRYRPGACISEKAKKTPNLAVRGLILFMGGK